MNINTKVLIKSVILGVGSGLAMLPLFNKEVTELEKTGINTHDNNTSFYISTVNTLIIVSVVSGYCMYEILTKKIQKNSTNISNRNKLILNVGKAVSLLNASIPVALLWNIELHDREVDGSKEFDQFIAWALITMFPLLIYKNLNTYDKIEKYILGEEINKDELELSLGSKLTLNGITCLSAVARGITFTSLFKELQNQQGINDNIALPLSVIVGGIITNLIQGISQFSDLKKIFVTKPNNINWQRMTIGVISLIEGGWFALPLVSKGLQATESWNILTKSILFTPFFLNNMNSESKEIYESLWKVSNTIKNKCKKRNSTVKESKTSELLEEEKEENN